MNKTTSMSELETELKQLIARRDELNAQLKKLGLDFNIARLGSSAQMTIKDDPRIIERRQIEIRNQIENILLNESRVRSRISEAEARRRVVVRNIRDGQKRQAQAKAMLEKKRAWFRSHRDVENEIGRAEGAVFLANENLRRWQHELDEIDAN